MDILHRIRFWITLPAILIFGFFIWFSFVSSPNNFPTNSTITIKQGESLQEISMYLRSQNIIKSTTAFRSLVILFGGEKKVIAGDYLLAKKENAVILAHRFAEGKFGIDLLKITIPEGWTVKEIGQYLKKNLTDFNQVKFDILTKNKEGYLFPDTYLVFPNANTDDVLKRMSDNFAIKIKQFSKDISASGHSEKEIITMASILEKEVLPKDMPVVSGILWKRISIGMPIQVDSSIGYINGKNTYEPTLSDLKIDSLYNTYKYKGLPPGPIGNPGVVAIASAIHPEKSEYLYYLTEKDGTIHYAKTFEEHKKNKAKFLK